MTGETEADWRRVVGALANRDARNVWAGMIVAGGAGDLSPSRRRRALALLEAARLVHPRPGQPGAFDADEEVFRTLLAASAAARPRREGVSRFLRSDGRIDRYPSSADDRTELLTHVVDGALEVGEVVSERELTERLARYSDDPAALRRYLVDAGLLERTPSGSEYARSGASR